MTSPLLGSLAATAHSALKGIFFDATLTRDAAGTIVDPADPPLPTQVIYTCKAIEQEYGRGVRASGLVDQTDINVLILANSLAVDPLPGDRIIIRGKAVTIVPASARGIKPVTSDPARATWECRCST